MKTTRISPFPVTQWTAVVNVCRDGRASEQRLAAAAICRDYWFPLYAFARRSGNKRQDAEDLTQGFFHYLLERNLISLANPELGKLRTFLLTAFQRFIGDVRSRNNAIKRGGGLEMLSLDVDAAERTFGEPSDTLTPVQIYDRNWALSVLQLTIKQLGESEENAGRGRQFALLENFINPRAQQENEYAGVAVELDISVETARKAVSRLRSRFRDLLRAQIASTLCSPSEEQVDGELAALKAALRG